MHLRFKLSFSSCDVGGVAKTRKMGPRRLALIAFATARVIVFAIVYAKCLVPEVNASRKGTWLTFGKSWALYFVLLAVVFLLVTVAVN